MSIESIQSIIGRAMTESEYRELLFSDPNKALEGYELTEEETNALKGMEREKFDAVAGELEERISRAGFLMGDLVLRKRPGVEPDLRVERIVDDAVGRPVLPDDPLQLVHGVGREKLLSRFYAHSRRNILDDDELAVHL